MLCCKIPEVDSQRSCVRSKLKTDMVTDREMEKFNLPDVLELL